MTNIGGGMSFKDIIKSNKLHYLMEAHDAISAKIVEETGFSGIWVGSLAISATHGARDCNELSWLETLMTLEHICDSVAIPVLLDADTGYGNFNNARLLVKRLEKINCMAVCVEDKIFPKTNSFLGGHQDLMDPDEFCGKIKAMKDAQTKDDFCVIARTEALISNNNVESALKRAKKYYEAGADGIFVHSKLTDSSEIESFMKEWKKPCPIIISPTTYATTPSNRFETMGIRVVIWANHMLRAAIFAMREMANRVSQEKSIVSIEHTIASLNDIFCLQNVQELKNAEKQYLP
jgi:phosphoenolpyruvate phosphomutase